MFVAPALVALVGYIAIKLPSWTGTDSPAIAAVAFTLGWWIINGMGPSLANWRMTGNHRIVRGIMFEVMRPG